jgi:sugar phosphate permease
MADVQGAAAATGARIELPDDVKRKRTWVLILLTIAYTSSYLDRTIIGAVAEHIKEDLQLSDTQLGLLTGLRLPCSTRRWGSPWPSCPTA